MSILRCPRCRSQLALTDGRPFCTDIDCVYSKEGFPVAAGQMVLVDFANSVFVRDAYLDDRGSVLERDDTGRGFRRRLAAFVTGTNPVAEENTRRFLSLLKQRSTRPRLLIVGGGAIGSGAGSLYDDPSIEVIGTDVYASANTKLVADAHSLPFADGSFDGVWIQAVLEHVLEPWRVADEIFRILSNDGLVYADTPVMQQVHEAAYDFTRFTRSGHRWLFRRFAQIDAGVVNGAGTALVWSIRYFVRSLGAPNKLATLAALPFFWLRFFDRLAKPQAGADAASGFYFLGRKSTETLGPKDIVAYYDTP